MPAREVTMSNGNTPGQAPPDLERRLATILCADVAGYSRMMGENEERTVRVFRGHREIFESLVAQHRGRIFNTAGDALLAEFPSAVEAVRCATDIQAALRTRNEHLAPEERMLFRIGVNLGDVIVHGSDLLGDGVNVAARIQAATEPGGICISGSVHEQIQNKLSLDFKLLGEMTYKNIAKPIRTYTINEGSAAITRPRRPSWKTPAAIAIGVALAAGAGILGLRRARGAACRARRAQAQLAQQKLATEQAQRQVEDAGARRGCREQKAAAEEALRRAQDERSRLERERGQAELAVQKLASERTQRHAEDAKRAAQASPSAAAAGPTRSDAYDGVYVGQLCNDWKKPPECWPVSIEVRNGIAEGSWPGHAHRTSRLRGTFADDGAVRFNLAAWTPGGAPTQADLAGRFAGGAITAAGKWSTGGEVSGSWHRGALAAAEPVKAKPGGPPEAARVRRGLWRADVQPLSRQAAPLLGHRPPRTRGEVHGSWMHSSGRMANVRGSLGAQGAVEMTAHGWNDKGDPTEATVAGRFANGALEVSGQWRGGIPLTGSWTRADAVAASAGGSASSGIARYDGAYAGRLCNREAEAPRCWGGVTLTVRGGEVQGRWVSHTSKIAAVRGTVADDGAVELTLASWDNKGKPAKADLRGRFADGAIHAAGHWAPRPEVTGEWKRVR